jgi:hypothetical protein
LSVNQEIVKIKSLNRVSSGISRYFDLKDSTGKYSTTNLFGTDGVMYKENINDSFTFSTATRSDIESVVRNQIEPILKSRKTKDFYIDRYSSVNQGPNFYSFYQQTSATNLSTGYIGDISSAEAKKVGTFTASNLRFIVPGSLLKFVPKEGYLFTKDNKQVEIAQADKDAKNYIWTKVINIIGDGTAGGAGCSWACSTPCATRR